jgi:hypothetical protein
MIRVEQIFHCSHPPVPDPTQKLRKGEEQRFLPAKLPVRVKSQGHSIVMEARYCLCTGEPIPMKREIEHHDPDIGRNR